MPKDYDQLPRSQVRRADRAVEDDAWIQDMLCSASIGVLATVRGGQPFINSNLFAYDPDAHVIYMHTARYGRTQHNVESEPETNVCFSVMEMGRLLPAAEALEFSVEYAGVVVFGRATLVEDKDEAKHGLQLLLTKYCPHLTPGEHYRPSTDDELKRTAVYRIAIDEWSGKRKAVSDEVATAKGAFMYGETPENFPNLLAQAQLEKPQ